MTTINVVLLGSSIYDFSLQNSLTGSITTFARAVITAPTAGQNIQAMFVNTTLPAGTYYLVGTEDPASTLRVPGWWVSDGTFVANAGSVANGVWFSSSGPTGPWALTSGVVNGYTYDAPTFVLNGVPVSGLITSATPNGAKAGTTVSVAVTSANLAGATFSIPGSDSTVSSVTIDPSGASASMQILAGSTPGFFNIVATNSVGSSPVAAGNQFIVLTATGYTATTTISVLNTAITPGSGYAQSRTLAVANANAPGASIAQSLWVSVLNNAAGVQSAALPPTAFAKGTPAIALNPAFLRTLPSGVQPTDSIPALVGQTIPLIVTGGADGLASLSFNGSILEPPIAAGQALFTVPAGPAVPQSIEISASAEGMDGAPLLIKPIPDPGRSVHGRLLAADGSIIPNAQVQLRTTGLDAEYFDFKTPLTALPNLLDHKPDREGFVSALNTVNPHSVFGEDPFGTGMMPDYAARFRGQILADTAGDYHFFLTSHAGSRLMIDGRTIADVPYPYSSGPDTVAGTVLLTPGGMTSK